MGGRLLTLIASFVVFCALVAAAGCAGCGEKSSGAPYNGTSIGTGGVHRRHRHRRWNPAAVDERGRQVRGGRHEPVRHDVVRSALDVRGRRRHRQLRHLPPRREPRDAPPAGERPPGRVRQRLLLRLPGPDRRRPESVRDLAGRRRGRVRSRHRPAARRHPARSSRRRPRSGPRTWCSWSTCPAACTATTSCRSCSASCATRWRSSRRPTRCRSSATPATRRSAWSRRRSRESARIVAVIDGLNAGGSTAGAAGLTLAYQQARAALHRGRDQPHPAVHRRRLQRRAVDDRPSCWRS